MKKSRKVVIVNKSDSTGGAAVVSFRLMMALRDAGIDVRMLVAEKLSDSPYVDVIASALRIKAAFMADRLTIALANGMNRATLFKLDAAAFGIDISRHPVVKDADTLIINWINQGVLSLRGITHLLRKGKKIVWIMHDMWNLTGICHHAGDCTHYLSPVECGNCPMLGNHARPKDLSHRIFINKKGLYEAGDIRFVAVSNWLAERGRRSSLLKGRKVEVIPNAFPIGDFRESRKSDMAEIQLIFGAARIDDDIKGFPILTEGLRVFKERYPVLAGRSRITLFGGIRNEELLSDIPIACEWKGVIKSGKEIEDLYRDSDIVISTSHYETLPGTLIEGQAYGCFPIAFDRGGQTDIIENGITGILVEWSDNPEQRGVRIAEAIKDAVILLEKDRKEIRRRMHHSVESRFSARSVAGAYISKGLL